MAAPLRSPLQAKHKRLRTRGQRSAGMVQGPLGTVENATMGCALTRTAPVYNPGERGARWFDKGGEFGHLSKPSVI